ncbi:DUF7159 family protein [Mycobacterium asiaticum]|uniref:DUF7159 domain-containing protein n=1 Tax=Mycobacterium asiaticum TaxID=1790 RepID=A0A1A3N584_MYCAS|nr:hypothetical protein [Mycobacterium asiaticum]OBK15532.1 hypothetical protein A5636_05575 [Mycobacterium asiaticum]
METVLGLSVTPTAVGWILAEGHSAEGAILDHHELHLQASGESGRHFGQGVRVTHTAEQVAAEVLRARDVAVADDHRLRVVGVTWSDEASAQAALLLEALTDAGFDNVVPVRLLDAVETLAQAIAPVIGYEQTAVCILEQEWATVVMVDTHDGHTQTAVKHVRGGLDGLTSWLTGMFDRSSWRPGGVVVVGSEGDVNEFSWQLEKVLPVPVFAQTMAQVTVARGAALAAAQSTEFTDAALVADSVAPAATTPTRSRQYAGAATTLAAAAVTFVASVSLAVGMQLAPGKNFAHAARPVVHTSTPPVAEAQTPRPVPPAAVPAATPPLPPQQEPVRLTAGEQVEEPAPAGQPDDEATPEPAPGNGPLRLSRVLEHIPGSYAEPGRPPE